MYQLEVGGHVNLFTGLVPKADCRVYKFHLACYEYTGKSRRAQLLTRPRSVHTMRFPSQDNYTNWTLFISFYLHCGHDN